MPLAQAVEILKRQCAVIKNVHLKYSEQVSTDWRMYLLVLFSVSCLCSLDQPLFVILSHCISFPLTWMW